MAMDRIQSTWMLSRLFTGPYMRPSSATSTVISPTLRLLSYFMIRMPPTRYRSIGPIVVRVLRSIKNQRPAIRSRIFSRIIRPLASS